MPAAVNPVCPGATWNATPPATPPAKLDEVTAFVAFVAVPVKLAVTVLALKLPEASRNTMLLAVLVEVAVIVAEFVWLVIKPATLANPTAPPPVEIIAVLWNDPSGNIKPFPELVT